MSITAKNKMIACFDGGLNLAKDRLDLFYFEENPINHKWVYETELDYHQNWNSLIQVAKKIINHDIKSCKNAKLKESLVTCDIISVYNEVVDYLIWYYQKIDSSIHAIN